MDWKPINEAPKDGRPLWVRGWDWGKPDTSRHCGWVYWNGSRWMWSGSERSFADYLTDFLPAAPREAEAVDFEHDVGALVKVTALNLPGTVIAQMRDSEGLAYRVVYWSDGVRKIEWLFGWEIERG